MEPVKAAHAVVEFAKDMLRCSREARLCRGVMGSVLRDISMDMLRSLTEGRIFSCKFVRQI